MRPNADCEVWLDGNPAACTVDTLKAGIPTVLEGLAVHWGRQNQLEQPDIGTCTFTMRDERASSDALTIAHVGADVQVYATGKVPTPQDQPVVNDGGWEMIKTGALPTNRYRLISGTPKVIVTTTQHRTGQQALRLAPGSPVVDATNLATNPSMEGGVLTGWASANASLYPVILDSSAPISGTCSAVSTRQSATINTTAATFQITGQVGSPAWIPISNGVPITVGLDLKAELANRQVRVSMNQYDANGTFLAATPYSVPIPATVAGQVQRIVVTITPNQATAARGYLIVAVISNSGNVTTGERVWVDNLMIGGDGTYFDGSTPAGGGYTYRWTGAVNASTSQRLSSQVKIIFPPLPFSPEGGDPTAWDAVPQMSPGDSWPVSLWVRLPAGTKASLITATSPTPYASDVGPSTAPASEVTSTGSWQQITGTVPNSSGGMAWPLIGVQASLPSPSRWQDQGTTIWTDHPETWQVGYSDVFLDDLVITGPQTFNRRVLVFAGTVTDVVVEPVTDDVITLTLTAADIGAALQNDAIGDEPWPSEALIIRSNKITSLAHLQVPVIVDTNLQQVMISYRDVDAQPVLALLQDLAQSVSATLWTATHGTAGSYFWMEDPDDRVSVRALQVDPGSGLITITASNRDVSVLSASDILRDPVRLTQTVNEVITVVQVTWLEQTLDDEGKSAPTERITTVTDDDAAEQYGRRRLGITTDLIDDTAANELGSKLLARSRKTGWRADSYTWDTGRVKDHLDTVSDDSRQVALMDLLDGGTRIGKALTLIDLPTWMPADTIASMYVEGGTYTFRGAWGLELTISPAQGQGQSVRWAGLPANDQWQWQDWSPDLHWMDLYGVAGPN